MRKFGFDLHGVLDTWPEMFKPLLEDLIQHNEIHIITGPSKKEAVEELMRLGYFHKIHYTHLFSMVDYLKESGIEMWQDAKGTWWCDDESWWSCKGKYCKSMNINVLFDDSQGYEKYMPSFTEFYLIRPPGDDEK